MNVRGQTLNVEEGAQLEMSNVELVERGGAMPVAVNLGLLGPMVLGIMLRLGLRLNRGLRVGSRQVRQLPS